jgi:hypothetical protein
MESLAFKAFGGFSFSSTQSIEAWDGFACFAVVCAAQIPWNTSWARILPLVALLRYGFTRFLAERSCPILDI